MVVVTVQGCCHRCEAFVWTCVSEVHFLRPVRVQVVLRSVTGIVVMSERISEPHWLVCIVVDVMVMLFGSGYGYGYGVWLFG